MTVYPTDVGVNLIGELRHIRGGELVHRDGLFVLI